MKKLLFTIIVFLFFAENIFSQFNVADSLYISTLAKIEYKKYNQADDIINQALEKKPNDYKLYLKKAEIYYLQSDYKNALFNFKIAEKLKKNCASYQLAECYSQMNNAEKSTNYLKIYLKSKNKLFSGEIRINPAFSNIEKSKEWIQIWKEKHYTKYEMKLSEAKYSASKNDYANAFEILDVILAKSKNKHQAYSMRGDFFWEIKDYKKAINDYSQASKIRKKNIDYLSKLANANLMAGKYKKALRIYNSLVEKKTYNLIFFYNRALIYNELKKYKLALSDIETYLKFYPENTEALYLSSKINYNSGDFYKALEELNLCIEKNKSNPKYFETRGDIHYNSGTYNYAIKDYTMALDLFPRSGEIYFKIGNVEFKKGNYKNACKNWKQAEHFKYYKASDFLVKYCKN